MEKDLQNLAINTLRFLSADGVQKANSGHPGLPLAFITTPALSSPSPRAAGRGQIQANGKIK
jgi:hypothetical protein